MLLTTHGKVMISLEGRCICPVHGELGPDAEYESGFAPCGCAWLPIAQSGLLQALHIHNGHSMNMAHQKGGTVGPTAGRNFA